MKSVIDGPAAFEVDFTQPSFYVAAAAIAFNPIFWNTCARQEYRTHFITKAFNGNALYGCYALAVTIFSLGIIRDLIYERALRNQPAQEQLLHPLVTVLGYGLVACGNVLVLSSMWALGITGTYLGDYFGILMDHVVTTFPFNVTGAPMYYGSTLSFLGTALIYGRSAGIILTLEVLSVYLVALRFEDPFTAEIYATRDRKRQQGQKVE